MARSRDELRVDHKLAFSLETLVQKQEQRTPIACRLCDEIFFDNKALLNHFQSHFLLNGTCNQNSLIRNLVSPKSETKIYSTSQNGRSFPVPVIAGKQAKNQNLGIPATLVFSNPVVSGPSHIPIQSRGPTFTHRHHPYQLPSLSRSAVGIGPSGSGPSGPLKFFSPTGPKRPDICTSKIMKGINTRFPMIPSASASPVISQFVTAGSFSSRILSTSLGKRPLEAIENEPDYLITLYTKPYIIQLDKPFEELADHDHFSAGGDKIPNELDFTLKL